MNKYKQYKYILSYNCRLFAAFRRRHRSNGRTMVTHWKCNTRVDDFCGPNRNRTKYRPPYSNEFVS